MPDVTPFIRVEYDPIIGRYQLGPAGHTWMALKRNVHRIIFPVCIPRQMVVETVVHLQGVVQWLKVIKEVRCPICDVDDELFVIESNTSIVDF